MIFSKIHDRALNGENFKSFLIELKAACDSLQIIDPVIILDNPRIHYYRGLNQIVQQLGLDLRYLFPYFPFLFPFENVFSVWKNLVLRRQCLNKNELRSAISEKFSEITYEHCDAFYRKMLGYITKSSRGEVINE